MCFQAPQSIFNLQLSIGFKIHCPHSVLQFIGKYRLISSFSPLYISMLPGVLEQKAKAKSLERTTIDQEPAAESRNSTVIYTHTHTHQ